MSPLDAALVRRKLAIIVRNLEDLEPIGRLTLEEYGADRILRKAAERMLQEAIEAAVDSNLHILKEAGREGPVDYFRSFVAMGEAGILQADLANRLAPAAGLRNRLVHQYDRLDDHRVLDSIRSAGQDLGDYVAAVEEFLLSSGPAG